MRRFVGVVLAFGAVLVLASCSGRTTGATGITEISATLHATGRCDSGETCRWYWEYWRANQPRSTSTNTPVQGPVTGPTGHRTLSADITGLNPGTAYRWVFCGSPNNGGVYVCAGSHGKFGSTTADPPPDYATFTTATWRIQNTPNPTGATASSLSGVSCTSATACTGVGSYTNSAGTRPPLTGLAERWNGTTWAIQTTPKPTGAKDSVLNGVSCTSATACTAVGSYVDNANAYMTLAERWDGTTWTIQSTPNPSGTQPTLLGVSCTSATACTAIGRYVNSAATQAALAERWDGVTWTIQSTPSPTGATDSVLNGVSCTSATVCSAVGSSTNSAGTQATLAERWDGMGWTIQPTPNPGGTVPALSGVSCTSATACTAVGSYTTSQELQATLAERWNGTTWTIQSTPNVGLSMLLGVSCTPATRCTAVGAEATQSAGGHTLAERRNGTTWTIQTTPNLSNPPLTLPTLSGASCTSATACTAIGSYTNSANIGVTLAERYSR